MARASLGGSFPKPSASLPFGSFVAAGHSRGAPALHPKRLAGPESPVCMLRCCVACAPRLLAGSSVQTSLVAQSLCRGRAKRQRSDERGRRQHPWHWLPGHRVPPPAQRRVTLRACHGPLQQLPGCGVAAPSTCRFGRRLVNSAKNCSSCPCTPARQHRGNGDGKRECPVRCGGRRAVGGHRRSRLWQHGGGRAAGASERRAGALFGPWQAAQAGRAPQ